MVVSAASIRMSLTPAASVWPTGVLASTWISKCRPLFFSRIAVGAEASPWKPISCASLRRPVLLPPFRATTSLPSTIL
ncbi:hypothetical protein D3C72_1393620 [compost metagenome]